MSVGLFAQAAEQAADHGQVADHVAEGVGVNGRVINRGVKLAR
jgi:hypothetical protein